MYCELQFRVLGTRLCFGTVPADRNHCELTAMAATHGIAYPSVRRRLRGLSHSSHNSLQAKGKSLAVLVTQGVNSYGDPQYLLIFPDALSLFEPYQSGLAKQCAAILKYLFPFQNPAPWVQRVAFLAALHVTPSSHTDTRQWTCAGLPSGAHRSAHKRSPIDEAPT